MIIDGKKIAQDMRTKLKDRVDALKARGIQPGFAAILIGDHPPSLIYVSNKQKAMQAIGIRCDIHHLPDTVTFSAVANLIDQLNQDRSVHGILLQLPVPEALDVGRLLNMIAPEKDVDGLTLLNVGRRTLGLPGLLPCTPKGCVKLIKHVQDDLTGLHAVVVGRSDLVGKPMAQLLLRENCTVTQVHAYSQNIANLCRMADILVVAIGKPAFIQPDWIKKYAIVIDVGITRVGDKIVGDVAQDPVPPHIKAITPVPGGVGPMTIACLLENTVEAAEALLV